MEYERSTRQSRFGKIHQQQSGDDGGHFGCREGSARGRPKTKSIRTDSRYLKDGITSWINKWKKNGWKTEKKEAVVNQDLWVKLDNLKSVLDVHWEWVKAHSSDYGNSQADSLAREAIQDISTSEHVEQINSDTVKDSTAAKTTASHTEQPPVQIVEDSINTHVRPCQQHVGTPLPGSSKSTKTQCVICTGDETKEMLQCAEQDCNSWVHYHCTKLPRHILYLYTTTKRKYTCEKCVPVPVSFEHMEKDASDNSTSRNHEKTQWLSQEQFVKEIDRVIK